MHERDRQHADTHAFLEVADRAIGRIRTKARVKAAETRGASLESPLQGWPSARGNPCWVRIGGAL